MTVSPVFAQGQWDPSMGMRHPNRPCMKVNSFGVDRRSPSEKASGDPYDTNNPPSQAARANGADSPTPGSLSPFVGEVAQLNARIAELEADLKYVYQGGVSSRCRTNFLEDRLATTGDTLPIHGNRDVIDACFEISFKKDYVWKSIQ